MINFVFTSLLAENYRVFAYDYHIDRLARNVKTEYGKTINKDEIKKLVFEKLPANLTLRIKVFPDLTYEVDSRDTTSDKEISCLLVEDIRNKVEVKSSSLNYSINSKSYAISQGFDDALWVKNGLVTEGVFWNAYFYRGNEIFTPAKNVFLGVCRQILIDSGMVIDSDLKSSEISNFEGAFYTNSSLLIGEIVKINNHTFEVNPNLKNKLKAVLRSYLKEIN